LKGECGQPFGEEVSSALVHYFSVSHFGGIVEKTPAFWARPAVPLGIIRRNGPTSSTTFFQAWRNSLNSER